MPKLYLVRHGRAAAAWDVDPDPGLDALGHEQAERMCATLAARGPMDVVTSPMTRARETILPLAQRWNLSPRIEPRVSEIPSPTQDLAARGHWLRRIAEQRWDLLEPPLHAWRQGILDALLELERDTVVTTHFMVINAAAGAALNEDRLVWSRPDYCSITVLEQAGGQLRLLERGEEAATRVL